MAAQGQNQGFHVLEDFVCQAVPNPALPPANPANQGRNEGVVAHDEILVDGGQRQTAARVEEPSRSEPRSAAALLEAIQEEVRRLSVIISESADPAGTAAL